jgi:hypothetical protein
MALATLLRHIQTFTHLPIEIGDVRAWVEERCTADRIAVYFTNLNPSILRGFIRRDRRRNSVYGDLEDIAEIHVSRHLEMPWRRLVACKEMIHLHDGKSAQVKTPEAFDRLVDDMVAHPYADGAPRSYSPPAIADILALWSALGVLCPLPLIGAFRREIREERMTSEDVANYLAVPTELMKWVLSPEFEDWVRQQMVRTV